MHWWQKTNDWLLQKAGTELRLLGTVRNLKLLYCGHYETGNVVWRETYSTARQRRRGRPRTCWDDSVRKWDGLAEDCLLRSTEDRRNGHQIVHESANPWIENGERTLGDARQAWGKRNCENDDEHHHHHHHHHHHFICPFTKLDFHITIHKQDRHVCRALTAALTQKVDTDFTSIGTFRSTFASFNLLVHCDQD